MRNGQQPIGLPSVGSVLPNPNGQVSRSFNSTGPNDLDLVIVGRVGYRFEHDFNESLRLRNSFRYNFSDDDDRNSGFFPSGLADDNRTLNRTASFGTQNYDTYQLVTDLLSKFETGSVQHELLFGFNLRRDVSNLNFESGADAAPVDIFNPVFDQTVVRGEPNFVRQNSRNGFGIFLQDQISFSDNFKALVGVRYDSFDDRSLDGLTGVESTQSGSALSPRIGLVYQPSDNLSFYANYGQSFAPSIGRNASNSPFDPERGTQYEIGVKADLSDGLSANLALYNLTRSNVTTSDPNDSNFSVQTGEQRSQGIELDVSGEIAPGWDIIASYTYSDARVTNDNSIPVGNRLFLSPENQFSLWTTYKIQEGDFQGWGVGLGLYYVGDRPADLANSFFLPSYLRTDAALYYENDQMRASLNIRNLFDVEYFESAYNVNGVYPGDPLSAQANLSWKF